MYELSFTFFIVDLQMQYIPKTDSCGHNITLPCSCFMQTVDEFILRKPTIVLYFVVLRPLRIDQVSQASLKVLMMCETLARAVLQDLYPRDYMLVLLGDQHDHTLGSNMRWYFHQMYIKASFFCTTNVHFGVICNISSTFVESALGLQRTAWLLVKCGSDCP